MEILFLWFHLCAEPNEFVHGNLQWKNLIEDKMRPLTNKTISGLYPPGSTIKTLVALSA